MKNQLTALLRMAVAVFVILLLAGCAGVATRSKALLAQDYHTMNDAEIQTYFYQLNDQLGREEKAAREASKRAGDEVTRGQVAEDLRDRRNEVRAELSRRKLLP